MRNKYYRCIGGCGKIYRVNSLITTDCCGFKCRFITDVEARESIEGRPFKGKRTKLLAKINSRADRNNKFRYSRTVISNGRSRESGEKK